MYIHKRVYVYVELYVYDRKNVCVSLVFRNSWRVAWLLLTKLFSIVNVSHCCN